jgi:hypothetical protein
MKKVVSKFHNCIANQNFFIDIRKKIRAEKRSRRNDFDEWSGGEMTESAHRFRNYISWRPDHMSSCI